MGKNLRKRSNKLKTFKRIAKNFLIIKAIENKNEILKKV